MAQVQEPIVQNKSIADVDELKPYKLQQSELSSHNGICLLLGTLVVIPLPDRSAMIVQLHENHPGICKMKSLARSYVWSRMDKDFEDKVRTCDIWLFFYGFFLSKPVGYIRCILLWHSLWLCLSHDTIQKVPQTTIVCPS